MMSKRKENLSSTVTAKTSCSSVQQQLGSAQVINQAQMKMTLASIKSSTS